ncbi:MAG: DUF3341 domain-containing protein [Flavobacteriales bacterium]|nr:DUF3341 domain-containing protein [Flavobacteriales bacterium]
MSKKLIHGLYNDDDVLLSGVKALREKGIRIKEVYTPFPVHGLDHAMGLAPTRLSIAGFIYGLIGLTFAISMMYYMMIADWPQNIGGKPSFTYLANMPAFVPIMFECTVLFAGHLMVITFLVRNGMFPGSPRQNPDVRTTDDMFLVEIESGGNVDEISDALKSTGAVEVNQKDA